MRIEVLRTGGFAAIRRQAAVDTSTHPDGPRLAALAESALAESAPVRPTVPDGFSYTITIDHRTLHATDPHLTPPQRELIQTLLGEGA